MDASEQLCIPRTRHPSGARGRELRDGGGSSYTPEEEEEERERNLCAVFRLILMRGIFRGFLWLVIVVCGQLVVIAVVSVLVRCLAEREAILSCWRVLAYILSWAKLTM